MPELPEVETTVRGLRSALVGRIITDVWLDLPKALVGPDAQSFVPRLRGQKILAVTRRAKYIVMQLSGDYLLVHLKMTGRLYVVPDEAMDTADRWVHFRFQLDNHHQLRFSDSRKFGRVYLVDDVTRITGRLGPEPLENDFTADVLRQRIAGRSTRIKTLLLNQEFLAGVGNIYADEALHLAHIHPLRMADTLSSDEIGALWQGIRTALTHGIQREGASIGWYRKPDGAKGSAQIDLLAYGRTGQRCLTCGQGLIEKITVGQRSTHFCPHCQE